MADVEWHKCPRQASVRPVKETVAAPSDGISPGDRSQRPDRLSFPVIPHVPKFQLPIICSTDLRHWELRITCQQSRSPGRRNQTPEAEDRVLGQSLELCQHHVVSGVSSCIFVRPDTAPRVRPFLGRWVRRLKPVRGTRTKQRGPRQQHVQQPGRFSGPGHADSWTLWQHPESVVCSDRIHPEIISAREILWIEVFWVVTPLRDSRSYVIIIMIVRVVTTVAMVMFLHDNCW